VSTASKTVHTHTCDRCRVSEVSDSVARPVGWGEVGIGQEGRGVGCADALRRDLCKRCLWAMSEWLRPTEAPTLPCSEFATGGGIDGTLCANCDALESAHTPS
jgi:hypothetical protein